MKPPASMANRSVRWAFNFSKWNPSESDMMLATACVQPEEKVRLAKFVFKKDFKASLVGRLMMRQMVHAVTSAPYSEIKFGRDDKGKPVLLSPVLGDSFKLAFNVSHHGNFVALAGEAGSTCVGVDVMKLEYSGTKTLDEYFRIMKKPFSDAEWLQIRGAGDEREQVAMFCRHWCLKESYVKAIGVGITVNLRDISFKINTTELKKDAVTTDTELFVEGVRENWTFQEVLLDDEHCVAVALCENEVNGSKPSENLVFRKLEFTEIMENAMPLLEFDRPYCVNYFQKL